MKEYADEEGLLLVIKASELSGEITTLTWNWKNYSNPVKEAYELMDKVHKLFLEIPEYEQRMGSKLNEYFSPSILMPHFSAGILPSKLM